MWICLQASACSFEYNQSFYFNLNRKKMSKTIKLDNEVQNEIKSDVLTEVEAIEGSPFSIVKIDDEYFLALGKYRLSELSKDKKEVLDSVNDTSWERMLALMHAVAIEVVANDKRKGGNNDK